MVSISANAMGIMSSDVYGNIVYIGNRTAAPVLLEGQEEDRDSIEKSMEIL